MNIALIGYGKMGKAIEEIALERGHTITARITSEKPLSDSDLSNADVAIEFTIPDLAVEHINFCMDENIPVIVGTTGWLDKLEEVKGSVNSKNGSLLFASNFSIGVNIFFEINKHLAKLMSEHSDYSVAVEEIHHTQKLDAPSGTAISLANGILNNNKNYESWVLGVEKEPHTNESQLGVTSFRKPNYPGTHTVQYDSDVDSISITHEAKNRKGFALGAVIAAEWIVGKKGIFSMSDVLNLNQ